MNDRTMDRPADLKRGSLPILPIPVRKDDGHKQAHTTSCTQRTESTDPRAEHERCGKEQSGGGAIRVANSNPIRSQVAGRYAPVAISYTYMYMYKIRGSSKKL